MRKAFLIVGAIVLTTLSAQADVKIKSKQTMMGNVSENTTYIKGQRSRTEMLNAAMISLTQCDLGRDVQISPATKTYLVSEYEDPTRTLSQPAAQKTGTPGQKGGTLYVTTTIKDTGERKEMFGYTARHIIQTVEMDSSPDACSTAKTKLEMDMWVIDAEFGAACQQTRQYRSFNPQSGGCVDKIVQKTLGTGKAGYPLWQKVTSFDANGKELYSMIQEVVELSRATLDQALFEVPAGYREVQDATQLYSPATSQHSNGGSPSAGPSSSVPTSSEPLQTASTTKDAKTADAYQVGREEVATVRVGLRGVTTTAAGPGVSAADLASSIRISLGEYLKGTNIELVPLDAPPAAQLDEARQKRCDYVVSATVSHKKGGGGFGGFGNVLSSVAPVVPMAAGAGGGYAAGQVVSAALVGASSVGGSIKKKDEITLDLKVLSIANDSAVLSKLFKTKAVSDGDDLISRVVEQAAQAILETIGK